MLWRMTEKLKKKKPKNKRSADSDGFDGCLQTL